MDEDASNDVEMARFDEIMKDVEQRRERRGSRAHDPSTGPRFPIGSRARVQGNSNNHDYRIGSTVEIRVFDENDRTYQARELGNKRVGNWIAEADLEATTEVGWAWLRTALPEEDVLLLGAFDGLERLTLSTRVRDTLVARLPGLKAAILRAQPEATGGDDAQ